MFIRNTLKEEKIKNSMAYHTNTNNKKTMLDKLTADKET